MERIAYDEFGYFSENAAEFGLPLISASLRRYWRDEAVQPPVRSAWAP